MTIVQEVAYMLIVDMLGESKESGSYRMHDKQNNRSIPVSYTHLDVYKRQVYFRVI